MLKGFRDFLLRGNVVELAVAVIIGAAFTAIVNAIAEGLITPLIGAVFGAPDFTTWNVGPFLFGDVIAAIVQFLITAAVIYFFIIVPMNAAVERLKLKEKDPVEEPSNQEKLLAEIRDLLRDGRQPSDGVRRELR
jgi:large conductance mechanosensitive channel